MSFLWTPTAIDLEQIEKMSKYWLPEKYIADILKVTLHQYKTARETDSRIEQAERNGRAQGAKRLYETAFNVAVDNKNVNMLMFVLKSQEGWRDSDPTNINIANFQGDLPTTEEAIKILQRAQRRQLDKPVEVVPLDQDVEVKGDV